MTILSKQFGNYTFNTCSDTGFICAKNILETYNKTADTPKLMCKLNEFMKRPKFLKSAMADFDKIVKDNKVDASYFNKSSEKKDGLSQFYSDMSTDDKFAYMIRQDFNMIGNTKRFNYILVHPNSAIKIAIWMSPKFGNSLIPSFKVNCSSVLIFLDENTIDLSNPERLQRNNTEEKISDRLAIENKGKREIQANGKRRIDILSDEYIIEVKEYCSRIKSIGQVIYYQASYPDRNLWIHLFNHNGKRDTFFKKACARYGIKLTYE
jgi:hypothetical protein